MSIVTFVWSMVSAVCLTLGILYVIVWLHRRDEPARFFFSIAALGVAALAAFELLLMHAPSVEAYRMLHRWAHVAVFLVFVSTVVFVHLYFRAGAKWLLWLHRAAAVVVLAVNFASPVSINFLEINGFSLVPVFGEFVNVPIGVFNPWARLGESSLLLVMAFMAHAAFQAWRRNEERDRRRAVVIGASVVFFFGLSIVGAGLMHRGLIVIPYFISVSFLWVILAMGYELSVDLLKATEVSRELNESRMRLELAAESSQLGFWEYDAVEDRFWVSDRLREILGFGRKQEIRMATWLAKVHPDDYEATALHSAATVKSGAELKLDYRLLMPTGEVRWLSAQGRSVPGQSGRVLGVVMDVSGQHESEHERTQLRELLAHSGRISMLGLLASSLAHELNQPLGAILRNAEAAQLLLAGESPDLAEVREILKDIQRDDQRAGNVISRLRGMLGGHTTDFQPVDFIALVDEVLALVRTEAAVKAVRLVREIGATRAVVRGDSVHLQQVLLNFVMNAFDALDSVDVGERSVEISAMSLTDGMLKVVVSDTGRGVLAEIAEKIFEPFYTTKGTGMGMGLAICRTIIEAHGGRIWLDPDRAKGAAFCFTLPLEPEAEQA
jgi:two-component system, LuxR family, sensor kinase FixL